MHLTDIYRYHMDAETGMWRKRQKQEMKVFQSVSQKWMSYNDDASLVKIHKLEMIMMWHLHLSLKL